MVTAEHKRNRYGYDYTYYHCSWRRPDYRCHQPSIQEEKLEGKLIEFLGEIAPPESIHEWAVSHLDLMEKDSKASAETKRRSREQALQATKKQLDNLTSLRIRDLISDEEFTEQRNVLQQQELKLTQEGQGESQADWFEPLDLALSFSKSAVAWFEAGDPRTKRTIMQIAGSNFVLKDQELNIDARKPFRRWPEKPTVSQMCGFLEDVRTELRGSYGNHLLLALRELATSHTPSGKCRLDTLADPEAHLAAG
jgi:site-specific DNA recombinase